MHVGAPFDENAKKWSAVRRDSGGGTYGGGPTGGWGGALRGTPFRLPVRTIPTDGSEPVARTPAPAPAPERRTGTGHRRREPEKRTGTEKDEPAPEKMLSIRW